MKTISVVVPMFNEEKVVAVCYDRLKNVLVSMQPFEFELIFVNDGSKDNTLDILKEIASQNPHVKIISFSRNFGHQIAVTAGLNKAKGDAVVVIDADLQDPPETLPKLIEKWQEGFQVVYMVRKKRKENIFKRLSYHLFYRLLQKLSSIDIPLDSGDFCLMDKKVVSHINSLPERNRFVRGLRSWVGYKQIGIEYERDKRLAGEVKYTLSKLIKLALDGILSFSYVPLRLATLTGFIVSSISFIGGIGVIASKYFADITPRGWTSTLVIVFFLGGIQLVTIGIIGEYVGRIYDEVKQRPHYIIEEEINF